MIILEHVAAETFRLVSNQVHGTSMDIEVDPYTMSLNGEEKTSPNSKSVGRNEHIAHELKHMWLYPYPEKAMA